MTWQSGLWGWGEADAGEWQALYRVEGARRALKAAYMEADSARWAVLAWDAQQARDAVTAAVATRQAAKRRAEMAAAQRRSEAEWPETVAQISAAAKEKLDPRAPWMAWAWAQGVKQRRVAAHLGLKNSTAVSTLCVQYIIAHHPEALSRPSRYYYETRQHVDINCDRQALLASHLKGTPEPARPSGWRDLPGESGESVAELKLIAPTWPSAGASAAQWRDISRERHRWVYERRAEGHTLQQIGDALRLSRERIRQMLKKEGRRQARRQKTVWSWYEIRQSPGRPLDMGGPRDVWLTYGPSPDPRLDNMVPVRSEDF